MNKKRLSKLAGEFTHLAERPDKVLIFVCPACSPGNNEKGEPIGHSIMVCFAEPSLFSSGAVWTKTSESIETVTVSPSINCAVPSSKCTFHGWIKDGEVQW